MAEHNSRHPYLSLLRPGEVWLHSRARCYGHSPKANLRSQTGSQAVVPLAYTLPRVRFMLAGMKRKALLVLGCLLAALSTACDGTAAPTMDNDATVEAK